MKLFLICFLFAFDRCENVVASKSEMNISDALTAYAFRLLKAQTEQSPIQNVVLSPQSIGELLLSLTIGSFGKTKSEIEQNAFGQQPSDKLDTSLPGFEHATLQSVTSVLINQDKRQHIHKNYSSVARRFNIKVGAWNFGDDDIRRAINSHIQREKTSSGIANFIRSDCWHTKNEILLLNKIFFNCDWAKEFGTVRADFFSIDDTVSHVTMLQQVGKKFGYYNDGYSTVLEVPYKETGLSMFLIKQQGQTSMSAEILNRFINAVRETEMSKIRIPKLTLNSTFNLAKIMRKTGITSLFNEDADLRAMATNNYKPRFSRIEHSVIFEINEEGLKAEDGTECAPGETFIADKPFYYAVVDKKRGNKVMLLGHFVKPEGVKSNSNGRVLYPDS